MSPNSLGDRTNLSSGSPQIAAKAKPIKARLRHADSHVSRPIRILSVSPQLSVRRMLRECLSRERDFIVVGEPQNADDVISLAMRRKADIVLLDFSVRTEAAFEILQHLHSSKVEARTISLTTRAIGLDIPRLLRIGGRGVVLIDSPNPMLAKGIRSVFDGQIWLTRQDLADVVTTLALAARPGRVTSSIHLTPRQRQVLKIVASGGTNREVAQQLSVSEDTVKHHITKILDKTGMSRRVELAVYAVEHGLLDIA